MDQGRKRQRQRNAILAIVLSILTLLAYRGVTGSGFTNYDDPAYVTENRHVQGGLSLEGLEWAFTASHTGNWHPLTWLSLMVDRQLYGMNPGGYHGTNLILHLANGLLLFFVLIRMTGRAGPGALVAAFFLIHPLHVESVAWVAERKDLLSALFWMLGMWGYARYVQLPGFRRYAWVLFFFVLGLLSKPMVVTFPFVLLLLDHWPLGRMADGWRALPRLLYEKIPLFVLSAASSVITFVVQRDGEAVASLENLPLLHRVGNALVAYAHYLVKTVWPVQLAVFYPHPGLWPAREICLAAALLLLITIFVVLKTKRHPYLAFGWCWYLGTLVPVIGLVQVGAQSMADRYTYLPLIGIFVTVAWGGAEIWKRNKAAGAAAGMVSAAVIAVLIVMTQTQVGYWKDSITLFQHAQSVTERNYQAQNNIGRALAAEDRRGEAVGYFLEALKSEPNYVPGHYNLALARMEQGRWEEAMRSFADALRIKPGDGSLLFSRGVLFARMGRWDEAIEDYRAALKKRRYDPLLRNNLGVALAHRGLIQEAIDAHREAIRLDPEHAGSHGNLAMLLAARGETDEAIDHFRLAVRYRPDYANAHYQLSLLLSGKGREGEAADHLREAKRINPEIQRVSER